MRKSWKVLPLAAMATVMVQFSFVGVPQAQTGGQVTAGTTAGTTGTGGTVGGTTGGTGGVAPTPIAVQPRFTG
jgi:hypothetical protein